MVLSVILFVYSLVSLAASIVLLYRRPVSCSGFGSAAAWCSALFFLLCHLILAILALYHALYPLAYRWFIGCLIMILLSRWMNGRILFGRTHWRHYAITTLLFSAAMILDRIF
ncbi:hypothetical protein NYE48_26535 [Paenibacillus sp. FSL M7-1455]|uniref:hypothetical protein n=1 Tax=Paenibacillus TaxID=44249 RepID=UPI000542FF65|nr:hypothetical protein [Paenibacillus cookii]KHF37553.1 hypothetical protein CM49_00073 [Paenibacillus sp. P1XP2]HWO55438.1 hypothetical protein [Paenibacillus cookii]